MRDWATKQALFESDDARDGWGGATRDGGLKEPIAPMLGRKCPSRFEQGRAFMRVMTMHRLRATRKKRSAAG